MKKANHQTYTFLLSATLACIAFSPVKQSDAAWAGQTRVNAEYSEELLLALNDKQSELLSQINNARQSEGLAPLTISAALSRAAQRHARDIVEHNSLTHTGSDGSSVRDRARREGYPTRYVGENVAAGNASVEDTFEQWMDSPGHRDNILSPNYTQIGIGYYLNAPDTTYDHYWVTVFGSPDR